MKSFSQTPVAKAFIHPEREVILKYIGFICDKTSDLNAIENLEDRKAAARAKAKWGGTEDKVLLEQIDELVFHYLSYFQYSLDFALLLSREELYAQMLQAIRDPIDITDADKYMKTIKIKGDINKLLQELLDGIKELRKEIYGIHEEQAAPKILKVRSPESRLKKDDKNNPTATPKG